MGAVGRFLRVRVVRGVCYPQRRMPLAPLVSASFVFLAGCGCSAGAGDGPSVCSASVRAVLVWPVVQHEDQQVGHVDAIVVMVPSMYGTLNG
jgi:hypothetical protein